MLLDIQKFKVAVMVPEENLSQVRDAICGEGAGVIGNYSYCTISTKCTGTFMGSENSNPYLGEKLKLEAYEEIKLEAICTADNIKAVLAAIRRVHPYEEPGIDIYPLIDEKSL